MKNLIILVLALVLLITVLCGCEENHAGQNGNTGDATQNNSNEEVSSIAYSDDEMKAIIFGIVNFEDDNGDEKVYCNAKLKDDFRDNKILVTLTKKKSWEKFTFAVDDFPEIELTAVHHSTHGVKEKILKQQEALKSVGVVYTDYETTKQKLIDRMSAGEFVPDELLMVDGIGIWLLNPDTYRESLSLELKSPSKENVLKAVKELGKRDDILGANPNYIVSLV